VTLVSLGAAVPARAELATDLGNTQALALFFVDGTRIGSVGCPDGTLRPSRVTCTVDERRVSANAFFRAADDLFPVSADAGARIREIAAAIKDVDSKIEMQFTMPVDPDTKERLRRELADAQDELTKVERTLTETLRQIRLVTDAMAAPGADPDLGLQLAQLLDAKAKQEGAAQSLRTKVVDRERAYVDFVSTGADGQDFEDLVAWRAELVTQWQSEQALYQAALDRVAAAHTVLRLLRDEVSAATVITRAGTAFARLKEAAGEVEGLFERAALAEGTSPASRWLAAVRKGGYDAATYKDVRIVGFRRTDTDGEWAVELRNFPDMESQCYEGATSTSLDLSRRSTKTEHAYCRAAAQPGAAGKVCYRVDVYENPAADRNYRLEIDVFFDGADRMRLRFESWCAKHGGSTTYWMYAGLEEASYELAR
jgi:hypothetical protein